MTEPYELTDALRAVAREAAGHDITDEDLLLALDCCRDEDNDDLAHDLATAPHDDEEAALMRAVMAVRDAGLGEAVVAGTREPRRYAFTPLDSLVGKTVAAVVRTHVPGPEGPEPCVRLHFTDGTKHGFVLPVDDVST